MIQSNVEPHGRIKRAVLIQTQPGQFVVESGRSLFIREVPIRNSAVGDRARDAMNQLPHGHFSSALVRISAVRNVAVEIF